MKLESLLIPGLLLAGAYLFLRGQGTQQDEGFSSTGGGAGGGGSWSSSSTQAAERTNAIAALGSVQPIGSYNPLSGVLMTRTGGMSISPANLARVDWTTGATKSTLAKPMSVAGAKVQVGDVFNPTYKGGVWLV
jgi:hypothetical protein